MITRKRLPLAALVLVLRCAAQTPEELLQKGIYTQETSGDPDAALQIYRQIVATASHQSPAAAQAQFRIAELLLQRGNLNGAAAEFSILASRYSEHQVLIANMAGRLRGVHNEAPAGAIRDGRFRDKRTGLEFAVPASWKATYNGPSSGDGNMVGFSDGSPVDFGVWMRPESSTPGEIAGKLQGVVADKVKMNAGRPGFAFRPESIQNRNIAGQQAVSAVADYVEGEKKLAAYYTWIYTAKTHAMFVARNVPVTDLPGAQSHLEQLVSTAVVP